MRFMSCREAMRLSAARLDRRLTLRERVGLQLHLFTCALCRAASSQLAAIDRLVRARMRLEDAGRLDGHEPGLSAEARERIREAVRQGGS